VAYISAVIPLYNEEQCLEELLSRLEPALTAVHQDYEIVFVDDGSRDQTWTLLQRLAGRNRRVKGIRFSRNFGQHCSITAGLDECDADWIVIMDGDLQDRPEEIARLHARAQEGYDVVLARRGRRKHPLPSRVTSWLFSRVFNYFTGLRRDEQVGSFRMLSRRVVQSFRGMREQMRYVGGMLEWMGFPTTTVDVQHDARAAGGSGYSLRKRWRMARDAIIAYSDKPLRLATQFGFVTAGLAFVYGGYIVVRALVRKTAVPGWSSLIASLFFIGGVIIATLGIVGIYLERTFAETKRRPLYVVRETLTQGGTDSPETAP